MSRGQAAQGEVSAQECFGHHAIHIPIETVAMTRPFAQRIAAMNAMYKLPANDRPTLPEDVADRLVKFKATLEEVLDVIMDSNESKLGADGKPIYDANGKFLKGPNYWKPEPKIKALLAKAEGGRRKSEGSAGT
jgi:hypothetical protein